MVEFNDGSLLAHMGAPDMRVPINIALFYPNRIPYASKRLDIETLGSLHFEPLSFERYPLLKAAIDAGIKGGIMPTILNAANEAAVALFLAGKITFLQIEEIVLKCLNEFEEVEKLDINTILKTDESVKAYVFELYS